MNKNFLKNKTIIVMGGGTAGWISSLYFLNKGKELDLNIKVKLISSNEIDPIGVGEGSTPILNTFIQKICNVSKSEFLRNTKGALKYGIKFENWNFDGEYYYHLFNKNRTLIDLDTNKTIDNIAIQYAINEDLNISQSLLQNKFLGLSYDLIENNKISPNINNEYSYHFSANLIIQFLKKKCLEFKNFNYVENTIRTILYNENGFINSLKVDNEIINGDFFINCLGFKSTDLLSKEYFSIKSWDNYILNDSAFAIQVKNSQSEIIEPYTTSTAQEYGWTWKIPQYEKTGYGYVYCSDFINDEDKLYDDIIKTYKINESNIFKTKIIKSKPYYNLKQIHKNCLSLGLASGFVEPLEATSIHMSLASLNIFFSLIENNFDINEKYSSIFNDNLEYMWKNVFKFIIFHYFTNNPINDYWKHYKNIQENNIFEFYEKYADVERNIFSSQAYLSVSFGLKLKDYYYNFYMKKYIDHIIDDYFNISNKINHSVFYSHNELLNDINLKGATKNKKMIYN